MGASLNDPAVKQRIEALTKDTAQAELDLKLDLVQAAVDAAGLVDPTPFSDAVGAAMSVARGDWFGAAMSVVSMVPYAGDAIGKTAKGAKLVARMAKLRKRIADNIVRGRQILANALKQDAAAIRAKRAADKARKIEDGIVSGCPVGGNSFGTQSPKLKFPVFHYATSRITAAIKGFCVGLLAPSQSLPKPSPPRSYASRRRRSAKAYSVRLVVEYRRGGACSRCAP